MAPTSRGGVERDDGNDSVSRMRCSPRVGRTVRPVVVCERTEVLPSRAGANRGGARTDRGTGTGRGSGHGPGGPGPVEPELLPDPEEGPRPHGPVLDREPGREPAPGTQAEAPPPQGGNPRGHRP